MQVYQVRKLYIKHVYKMLIYRDVYFLEKKKYWTEVVILSNAFVIKYSGMLHIMRYFLL